MAWLLPLLVAGAVVTGLDAVYTYTWWVIVRRWEKGPIPWQRYFFALGTIAFDAFWCVWFILQVKGRM
jgi:hypothetical protein